MSEIAPAGQSVMLGGGSLYEELRDVFMKEYEPTPIHRFLARLPRLLAEHGHPANHLLLAPA